MSRQAVQLTLFVLLVLGCVALGAGLSARFGSFTVPSLALEVAALVCKPNQGVQAIRVSSLLVESSRYTIVCANGAHFLDNEIRPKPEPARKAGDPIPTDTLLKGVQ